MTGRTSHGTHSAIRFSGDSLVSCCFLLLVGTVLIASCGAEPTPVPTPTPSSPPTQTLIPTTVPTPTPIPDSDGDGLFDSQELQIGTNPFQRDSDVDGIDDGTEVELGTDPLFRDTDRDGVVDGDDVLPLADAKVRVSILEFADKTKRGFLHKDTNAFFVILVDNIEPVVTEVYDNVQNQRVAPVIVNVPDNIQSTRVGIVAFEHTPLANIIESQIVEALVTIVTGFPIPLAIPQEDKPYDISGSSGTTLDSKMLVVDLNARNSANAIGDGADDGELDGLEAKLTVRVDYGNY